MARTRRSRVKKKISDFELAPGQLSRTFWEHEVEKSQTATREHINNTPPPEVLERASALAQNVLQPIRDHFGIPFSPGSWYRSEALERIIARGGFARWLHKRGLPRSEANWQVYFSGKSHPKGEAADLEIPGVPNRDLYEWIKENLEFDQLILEGYVNGKPRSGWIHVSWRGDENRNQAFEMPDP